MRKLLCLIALGIGIFNNPIPVDASTHAWVVDWDNSSYIEYKKNKSHYSGVSNFAVSFNENLSFILPKEIEASNKYLSFVNDTNFVPKSQSLLDLILKDDKVADKVISNMIQASKGYSGIELDFEGFWKNEALTKQYMRFTYRLYRQCLKNNLKLRIVLEPSFTKQDFIKGPEYVVMAYNLYGKHSGPGPKANYEFIDKLIEKSKILPDVSFAIANGGCLWGEKPMYLTYNQIQNLEPTNIVRDKSDVLVADTKQGKVWYADEVTIENWTKYINNKGYNVSIWRLGGNF